MDDLPPRKIGFLADIFCGVNNRSWDLGRILVAFGMTLLSIAEGFKIYYQQPMDLGPTGLGGSIAALFTSGAALIYFKDQANTNAVSQVKQDNTAAVTANTEASVASSDATGPKEVVIVNLPEEPANVLDVKDANP